jgi:dTDP-4-dehydrorhamnose 3,5-epimerase
MTFVPTELNDVIEIIPRVFVDDRGAFFESFQQEKFNEAVGRNVIFVQDNESISKKNVVRGLHFQIPPFAQGKLVRVIQGAVMDVAVDIRKNSPTFGQHVKRLLTAENKHQLWIPEGFAHGFVALEDATIFQYKCTNYYHSASEQSLLWNDHDLAIDWGITQAIVSEKDTTASLFHSFLSPF